MKRVFLNGKDINIDVDFFKLLGADPDSFEKLGEYGTYHRLGFTTFAGRFCAFWDELDNVLRIVCEGLDYAEADLETERLNDMNMCLLSLDLMSDGIFYRSGVVRLEGEHPVLRIAFFQK